MRLCRLCGHTLSVILDFGEQCLGGHFPGPGEPDPPRYPLVLCSCPACGLIQLGHTVPPSKMFGSGYGYRSGVTETMRRHLEGIATDAVQGLGRTPRRVLDIGCNDGTLLSCVGAPEKVGIDPTNLDAVWPHFARIQGMFPQDLPKHPDLTGFDLIFSIACFYDADDPVAFAKAVRANLADDGVWCCEVADANAMLEGAWDSICHEHLCYYTRESFTHVCNRAGLYWFKCEKNKCNGGSLRFWVRKAELESTDVPKGKMDHSSLATWVKLSRESIRKFLGEMIVAQKPVHLLGASTKANTWLQHCGAIASGGIQVASDRDPRKHGCRTPGTNIPIVSEEESRAMKPDVYVCAPWHFRDEILEREKDFLGRGGQMVFPLPTLEVVTK